MVSDMGKSPWRTAIATPPATATPRSKGATSLRSLTGIMVYFREIIPKWPDFRLVKYYNLLRYMNNMYTAVI